jgi:hypothetical protein
MSDWTSDAADLIERTVANVRDRTVEPVRKVTRAIVFGTLAVCFAIPAALLLAVLAFRLLVLLWNLLPGPDDNTWIAWYTLGVAAVGGGMVLFSRRNAKPSRDH